MTPTDYYMAASSPVTPPTAHFTIPAGVIMWFSVLNRNADAYYWLGPEVPMNPTKVPLAFLGRVGI